VISVLLVDDYALIRMGFRLVLDAEDDIEVVGEAADGTAAVSMCSALRPDVVLMDVRMPGHDGIEATRDIVAAGLPSKVLILTTFDLDDYVYAGLRAGASGFLLKDTQPADLVAAIRTIAAGDAVLAPAATSRLIRQFAATPPGAHPSPRPGAPASADPGDAGAQIRKTLTDREQDVFSRIATGMSNSEIAASLFLSEGTVKIHVGRILAKLGLRDRVQAVVLAYESRLITPGTPSGGPEPGLGSGRSSDPGFLLIPGAFAAPPPRGEGARARLAHYGYPYRHERYNDHDNQLNTHPDTS
jgi:DNA-binding NarL/FixJ family response regulator